MTKLCNKCSTIKSLDEFYKDKNRADGRTSLCKECIKAYQKAYQSENRSQLNTKRNERRRNLRKSDNQRALEQDRIDRNRKKFKISISEYDHILASQDFRCAICRKHQDEFDKRFSVDHDHSCCPGKKSCGPCIRGLLCFGCNVGIGHLRDNIKNLQSAIEYLNK